MNAEQQEEFEVLQSIFPDTFQELSQSPPVWQLRIESDMITVVLVANITDAYPHEAPQLSIECTRGKYPDMTKLKSDLKEEAERNVGMAMIFSLSSMIEERLSEYVTAVRAAEKKPEKKAESYNEIRKFDGTPVTIERFHEWNAKFMAEVAKKRAADELKRKAELGNKLTGRQLFEMNKVTASSDSAYFADAGMDIDEAVFEGLEDLDLVDDDGHDSIDDDDKCNIELGTSDSE